MKRELVLRSGESIDRPGALYVCMCMCHCSTEIDAHTMCRRCVQTAADADAASANTLYSSWIPLNSPMNLNLLWWKCVHPSNSFSFIQNSPSIIANTYTSCSNSSCTNTNRQEKETTKFQASFRFLQCLVCAFASSCMNFYLTRSSSPSTCNMLSLNEDSNFASNTNQLFFMLPLTLSLSISKSLPKDLLLLFFLLQPTEKVGRKKRLEVKEGSRLVIERQRLSLNVWPFLLEANHSYFSLETRASLMTKSRKTAAATTCAMCCICNVYPHTVYRL